jgi:predicted double-glycine peptidase
LSKRTVSGIVLTLLLTGTLSLAFNIQPVRANGTTYTREDDSIDPPTASISAANTVTYAYLTCLPVLSYSSESNWAWFSNGASPYLNDYDVTNYVYSNYHIGEHMPHYISYWDFGDLDSTIQPSDILNVTLRVYYYWQDAGVMRQSNLYFQIWNGSNYITIINVACLGSVIQPWQNKTSSDIWASIFNRNITNLNNARLQLYWVGDSQSGTIYVSYAELQVYWTSDPAHSDISSGRSVAGLSTTFSCRWIALTANLSGYVFGTNNTGSWVNEAWRSFDPGTNTEWANVTKTLNAQTGATIEYEWWCNDTNGKWASTQVQSFKTQERKNLISVPYHQQVKNYYCGEAALEMVLDYYGPDILQYQIGNVARVEFSIGTYGFELQRACHFSNMSTSMGNDAPGYNCTGYTGRSTGYGGFEWWFAEQTCIEDLKNLIDQGNPIVVLMWYDSSHTNGHFRVVVGYDDSGITVHDPWDGASIHYSNSLFKDLWSYSNREGLFASPWSIELNIPGHMIGNSIFEVSANVTYVCPSPFGLYSEYRADSCNATISLPLGFSLVSGENATKVLSSDYFYCRESRTVTWQVVASPSVGSYSISVNTSGIVHGFVAAHGSYPSYSYNDRIGGENNSNIYIEQAYFLEVSTEPDGITTILGEGWYPNGTLVALAASLYVNVSNNVRYRFDYWDVDSTPRSVGVNPITVTIDANHTATAHYILQYSVTFAQTGLSPDATDTVVTVNGEFRNCGDLPFTMWVDSGSIVTYDYKTIVPSNISGKRFRLDFISGPTSPLTVATPLAITGAYNMQHFLTIGTDPTCIVTIPGEGWYDTSADVSLTAPSVINYQFSYWDIDGTYQGNGVNPITVSMGTGHTAIAHYMSLLQHDINITNVTDIKNIIGLGFFTYINVTVTNQGDYTEIFKVTLYANTTIIDTLEGITLASRDSTTITLTWTTSSFAEGNYTIWAYVEPVSGETDTEDNIRYFDGIVKVTVPGDVNGDFKVNLDDITSLLDGFGSTISSDGYYRHTSPCIYCPHSPNCDIDCDGKIALSDITAALDNFGKTYP